jgi:hypothetical protein
VVAVQAARLVAQGKDGGLGPILKIEPGEDAADGGLHRLFPDAELTGDLTVALAAGDQLEHYAFAPGERAQGVVTWVVAACIWLGMQ